MSGLSPAPLDLGSSYLHRAHTMAGAHHSTTQRSQVHRRQKRKHRPEEEEESNLFHTPKRFLSEEAMAACLQLQQLNITTTHTLTSNQLTIKTVAPCQEGKLRHTPGRRKSNSSSLGLPSVARLPGIDTFLPRPGQLPGDGSHDKLASPTSLSLSVNGGNGFSLKKKAPPQTSKVQINITPATPTTTASCLPAINDSDTTVPMVTQSAASSEHDKLSHAHTKNCDIIILDDISSDSSDDSSSPERISDVRPHSLWLAPELRSNGLCGCPNLLPKPILDEFDKKGKELVLWVEPDRYFLQTVKGHSQAECVKDKEEQENQSTPDSIEEDTTLRSIPERIEEDTTLRSIPESIEEDKLWDYDEMEF